MTRTPTSRWAVATPPTPRGATIGLGMTVWSWHRHWWQAYAEVLLGTPYAAPWRVVSAKTLDASWARFRADQEEMS